MVEPPRDLVVHHLGSFMFGNVGDPSLVRDAVHVDEMCEAERLCIGQLCHQRAALGVSDNRKGLTRAYVIKDREGIAHVGIPRIQLGVLAVAVPSLIPAHYAPTTVGQLGGEQVEGACEVESAVHE